jgi:hypothetical protein
VARLSVWVEYTALARNSNSNEIRQLIELAIRFVEAKDTKGTFLVEIACSWPIDLHFSFASAMLISSKAGACHRHMEGLGCR